MKWIHCFAVVALLAGVSSWKIASAKDTKIGYINSQQIMADFSESQEAQKKLEKEEGEYSKKADSLKTEIEKLRDLYEKQSAMMTDEKKKDKETEILTKMDALKKFQQDTWGPEGKLYQRNSELTKPILDKVNGIIKKVGEQDGYDIIFDVVPGGVVYAKPSDDLTSRIIEELSKK